MRPAPVSFTFGVNNMKKSHFIVFSVLAFVTGGVAIFHLRNGAGIHQLPASFDECVAEGGIVDSHDRDVCRRTYRISSDPVLFNLCVEQKRFREWVACQGPPGSGISGDSGCEFIIRKTQIDN